MGCSAIKKLTNYGSPNYVNILRPPVISSVLRPHIIISILLLSILSLPINYTVRFNYPTILSNDQEANINMKKMLRPALQSSSPLLITMCYNEVIPFAHVFVLSL